MAEIIKLSNRREIELNINGRDCILSFGVKNIAHFQEQNKCGLQDALKKMQEGDIEMILKFIYSMVSDAKTKRVLGKNFFKAFDEMDIIQYLAPLAKELINKEMPEAKTKSEKK